MTTFILVHGAFGSSAELAPVIPELEALGHRAIAVDLPCTDPVATLDDYARTVVEAMAGIAGPVVVVGHSAGGATISLVPARTRVDRLVYVTAVVPEPGRSIVDIAGADVRETILSVSHDDGNGCRSFDFELLASLAPPEERDVYLSFLRATQRPQGWAALEQPWPGRSLPAHTSVRRDVGHSGHRPRAEHVAVAGRQAGHGAGGQEPALPDAHRAAPALQQHRQEGGAREDDDDESHEDAP